MASNAVKELTLLDALEGRCNELLACSERDKVYITTLEAQIDILHGCAEGTPPRLAAVGPRSFGDETTEAGVGSIPALPPPTTEVSHCLKHPDLSTADNVAPSDSNEKALKGDHVEGALRAWYTRQLVLERGATADILHRMQLKVDGVNAELETYLKVRLVVEQHGVAYGLLKCSCCCFHRTKSP